MSVEKERFASRMIKAVTDLARIHNDMRDLFQVYFVRGYNSGGGDTIIDADVASAGLTAAELASAITLAENLPKFLTGQASFTSDYSATIANIRNDI
jgi:hypothetical protein